LKRFDQLHSQLVNERNVLSSVEILLGFSETQFPELSIIGFEVERLWGLYGLYEAFSKLTQTFQAALWTVVDLPKTEHELQDLHTSLSSLPADLRAKDAFDQMLTTVLEQLEVRGAVKAKETLSHDQYPTRLFHSSSCYLAPVFGIGIGER
jgi:hypothetical protein